MKVYEILECTKAKLLQGNEDDIIGVFERDSREIKEGYTYIALKGENFDGNDFIKEAIENGASTCIISKNNFSINNNDVNIIYVKDTLKALHEIATYKRSEINIPVVAVTGSVGKTSTKDIIASVMSKKFKVLKTQRNLNNDIGLPLTILSYKDEEAIVCEMGMNHFGEISKLTKIAKPTLAVITNIGTAHIGNLGSRENILKAKLEILEGLQGNSVVVNNDNDLLHKWQEENKNKYNIITFGIENKSEYQAKDIELFEDKSTYILDKENIKVEVPVPGAHYVINSLCAISIGRYFDIPLESILEGIRDFELTKSRMEILKSSSGATIINDAYNANFDSMKAAIKYLENIQGKRKIAVLGDMFELGEFAEPLHEAVGKEIKDIDILITVGELSKLISKTAHTKEKYEFQTNEEAIEKIKSIIEKDDAILLKASNSMKFEDIVEAIL